MRRGIAHQHPLSWLVGRFAGMALLAVIAGAAGAVLAAQRSWWALALSVVPFVVALRSVWLGWWLGAAVVAELRWRAILARLIRQSRHRSR